MAQTYFATIGEIKAHVGGGANVSLEINSIGPSIEDTAYRHHLPWIGQTLFDLFADGAASLTPEQAKAKTLFLRSLAQLSIFEYMKIGAVHLTESGIHRAENDSFHTAFRYQERDFSQKMLESGYENLERLLIYLDQNRTAFAASWVAEVAPRYDETIVRTAAEARRFYSHYLDRFTFEIIRPIIHDAERWLLRGNVPERLVADLRAVYLAGTAVGGNVHEWNAIRLLQAAVTHYAIKDAIDRHYVQISGNRVVQVDMLVEQASKSEMPAPGAPFSIKNRHHSIWANRHWREFRDYVQKYPDMFPSAYCTADGGTNTDADAWCSNSTAASTDASGCSTCAERQPAPVFGHACGCHGSCNCGPGQKKSGKIVIL